MLVLGINHSVESGMTNSGWVVMHYIFQSSGELFIGPIGYAMVGRLSPSGMTGIMMGTFMLSSGIGASLASYFASLISNPVGNSPLLTNSSYHDTFLKLGESGIVMVLILLSVSYYHHVINKKSISSRKVGA